ncbi:MAG: hypothetical protein ABIH92_03175 [Nanoarchaeota archaeon]
MLSKEEKHFIEMCGCSGMIFGCRFIPDKKNGDSIKSKYNDPVYQVGMKKIIDDRMWRDNLVRRVKK